MMAAHGRPPRYIDVASVVFRADAVLSKDFVANNDEYWSGLADGVFDGYTTLRRQALKCPQQRFVIAGYSQGAMVMHRLLKQLDAENKALLAKVDAALLIGDADRVPEDRTRGRYGSMHRSRRGLGLAPPAVDSSKSSHTKFSKRAGSRVLEVCNRNDPVCDYPGKTITTHFGYPTSPDLKEAADDAVQLVLGVPLPKPSQIDIETVPGRPLARKLQAGVIRGSSLQWATAPGHNLPPGVTLSRSGLLEGTPSAAAPSGTTSLRVRAVHGKRRFLRGTSAWVPVLVRWNATAFTRHANPRFGFAVDVPSKWSSDGDPANGDGFGFTSPDKSAHLAAWGANNVLGDDEGSALQRALSEAMEQGRTVSYKDRLADGYVLSGNDADGRIYYTRVWVGSGSIDTISWNYPSADKGVYSPLVERTVASLVPGDLTVAH